MFDFMLKAIVEYNTLNNGIEKICEKLKKPDRVVTIRSTYLSILPGPRLIHNTHEAVLGRYIDAQMDAQSEISWAIVLR